MALVKLDTEGVDKLKDSDQNKFVNLDLEGQTTVNDWIQFDITNFNQQGKAPAKRLYIGGGPALRPLLWELQDPAFTTETGTVRGQNPNNVGQFVSGTDEVEKFGGICSDIPYYVDFIKMISGDVNQLSKMMRYWNVEPDLTVQSRKINVNQTMDKGDDRKDILDVPVQLMLHSTRFLEVNIREALGNNQTSFSLMLHVAARGSVEQFTSVKTRKQ